MARVRDGASVLTVTEKGLGRKTSLETYRIQKRGGMGLKNYSCKNDYVCGIKVIDEEDDIIMISTDGVIIRLRASDIRPMSRYARGVRLMRVNGDDKVVAFTRAERDETAEVTQIENPDEEIIDGDIEKIKKEEEESEKAVENADVDSEE
jgi:DNA gyrase subunit A